MPLRPTSRCPAQVPATAAAASALRRGEVRATPWTTAPATAPTPTPQAPRRAPSPPLPHVAPRFVVAGVAAHVEALGLAMSTRAAPDFADGHAWSSERTFAPASGELAADVVTEPIEAADHVPGALHLPSVRPVAATGAAENVGLRNLREPPSPYVGLARGCQPFYPEWHRLPRVHRLDADAAATTVCPITLEPVVALEEPVGLPFGEVVHVFAYDALRRSWEEGGRFINPVNRQRATPEDLLQIVVCQVEKGCDCTVRTSVDE